MKSMQDKLIDALETAITDMELEPVDQRKYANTGTLYATDGLATLLEVSYSFQDTYCTLTFRVPGLNLEEVGIRDAPPLYRVQRNELSFHKLDYPDGDRLQGAVLIVHTLIQAFRDQLGY